MPVNDALLQWLREAYAAFEFDVAAIFKRAGHHSWPLEAQDPVDLERQLDAGGHFLPLPREPAALANVLEVTLVDFVVEQAGFVEGLELRRGTERGYPDIEVSGDRFGGGFHAVDLKAARRASSGRRTPPQTNSGVLTISKRPSMTPGRSRSHGESFETKTAM